MGNAETESLPATIETYVCTFFKKLITQISLIQLISRKCIDQNIVLFPELFPPEISKGYQMKDIYYPKKQSVPIRRIEIAGIAYTIRPSFLLPYMTGKTDEVEKALFLRKFNVPFWALSYVFGRDPSYWYRTEQSIGRNSIVGTTIRNPDDLPQHLAADENIPGFRL